MKLRTNDRRLKPAPQTPCLPTSLWRGICPAAVLPVVQEDPISRLRFPNGGAGLRSLVSKKWGNSSPVSLATTGEKW
jgi:hypothetical protein